MDHLRYPQDLFKVQRELLTRYHVTDPQTFLSGSEAWAVPDDPTTKAGTAVPPYYLSMKMPGQKEKDQVFSLTTTFTPNERDNLSAFMAVNADPGTPDYGKISMLKLPTSKPVGRPQAGPEQVPVRTEDRRVDPPAARWRLGGRVRKPAHGPARRRNALRRAGVRAQLRAEVPAAAQGARDLRRPDGLRGHAGEGAERGLRGRGADRSGAAGPAAGRGHGHAARPSRTRRSRRPSPTRRRPSRTPRRPGRPATGRPSARPRTRSRRR